MDVWLMATFLNHHNRHERWLWHTRPQGWGPTYRRVNVFSYHSVCPICQYMRHCLTENPGGKRLAGLQIET